MACAVVLVLLSLFPDVSRNRLERVLGRSRVSTVRRTRWRVPSIRSGESTRRRRAVVMLCRVLAAELRSGQPPQEALRVATAEAGPLVGPVATDAESLRLAADRDPDLWALAYLAVCWEVAADTGAGLAEVVDTLAHDLTEQEDQRSEASARTSGPRATAFVLTGLPLVGTAMSLALGGSPLAFLLTTPLGLTCLLLGVTLDALGVWWTLRMVRSATTAV